MFPSFYKNSLFTANPFVQKKITSLFLYRFPVRAPSERGRRILLKISWVFSKNLTEF